MAVAKIAITIEEETLRRLDRLVKERKFPNRSKAIQDALETSIERSERNRLAVECAKLDPREEATIAEEGMGFEAEVWPEY
jgi:metal-responsive CopG/Arc/MetJ family transcriptional regulator